MKINPNYDRDSFILPGKVLRNLNRLSKAEIAVIMYVYMHREFSIIDMAEDLKTDIDVLSSLLVKLAGAGYFYPDDQTSEDDRPEESASVMKRPDTERELTSLSGYSLKEVSSYLEKNKSSAKLIDACQKILKKIFSSAEISILIGMIEQLDLSDEYILLLCKYAQSIDKRSLRYIEKMALDFYDRGICTYTELEKELDRLQRANSMTSSVRKLYGMGDRSLTKKEKDIIYTWSNTFGYNIDIIEKAYEITISNTSKPSLNYTNGILENWYENGVKTVKNAEEFIDEFKRSRKPAASAGKEKKKDVPEKKNGSSFNTDSFFEGALKRSYKKNSSKGEN